MKYLHTMIRVTNLEESLDFYCNKMGMAEVRRIDNDKGRFTLVFLSASQDQKNIADTITGATSMSPVLELTFNWDPEEYTGGRNFGHLAYSVENIYSICQKLMDEGVVINRPPRDGKMAFIRSPDGISIELLQQGNALEQAEPWASMANIGSW